MPSKSSRLTTLTTKRAQCSSRSASPIGIVLLNSAASSGFSNWRVIPSLYPLFLRVGFSDNLLDYRAALSWLIARENILKGNSKLTTTETLAEIGGPALAGLLIQTITAPFVILVDALSFVISVITLVAIRKDEPLPSPAKSHESWLSEIGQGLQVVIQQPVL